MKCLALFLAVFCVAAIAAGQSTGLKGLDEAWAKAANANDLDAMVALYAPDAVLYPPDGMEARGSDAIRAHLAPMFASNTLRDVKIDGERYETRSDISTGWGRFTMTLVPKTGGEPVTFGGRFTAVAKRTGGRWFYIVDHASAPLPAPAPTPTPERAGGVDLRPVEGVGSEVLGVGD
jgi:uncharacterized protein (TIGR02246 family)